MTAAAEDVPEEEDGEGELPDEDDASESIEEPADSDTTDVIEFQEFGNAYSSSTGMVLMSTGFGSVSQYEVEQKSGLDLGELDSDLNNTKESLNATEGSGVLASFKAAAGDVVSFEYIFGTNDYIPYQDFSFYSVNGEAQSLAVVGVDTADYGNTSGIINYTLTDQDLNNSNGGNIQFAVGVMDALDTCVETNLVLNDFKVTKSDSTESDFSGKGLIDGLDAYMVSASLTETFDANTGESNDDGTILKLTMQTVRHWVTAQVRIGISVD